MKKKILVAPLLVGLLTLTGCGGNSASAFYEDVDNWSNIETGQLQFDTEGNVVYNNLTLELFTITAGTDIEGLNALVNKFNDAYTGKIKINVNVQGEGSYMNDLSQRIKNGNSPDIAMFHNEDLASQQRSHQFQPIDRIIEKSGIDWDISDFPELLLKNNKVANKLFGVSVDAHSAVVLYRQDLLDKYGKSFPKNFNEFIDTAYTIQQGERNEGKASFEGVSMSSNAFAISQYAFNTAIMQNGGSFLDGTTYRPTWTSSDAVAIRTAAQMFKDMYYGTKAVSTFGTAETQPDSDFSVGNCAFSINYTWEIDSVLRIFDSKFDEDDRGIASLSNLFAMDNTKAYASDIFGISHGLYIPYNITDITRKAAAVEFMKYFTQHSISWNGYGHLPTSKSYSQSDEYLNAKTTVEKTQYFGNISNYRNFPFNYTFSIYKDNLKNVFTQCCLSASSNVDNIIQKYEGYVNDNIDLILK